MSHAIATQVAADMQAASFIREMFEKGRRLKAEHGDDHVYDFSLGNPNATPPDAYFQALVAVANERRPAQHRYMPNAGFDETRAAVARFLTKEYGLEFDAGTVIMTSGAAGGMNVVLHAICDPGDEIITLAPYFPEYRFYIQQAGGKMVLLQTDESFQPDLAVIQAALTQHTRGIIINTPNNPSGAVYTQDKLKALAELLGAHETPARPIYVLCDDPYRRIVYDLEHCPTIAHHYPRTVIVSSYSKDLSIAGERAGYIGIPPALPEKPLLLGALTMLNRTLGFVNAAATTQRVVARCAEALCDVSFYRQNRDLMCHALREFGYDLLMPRGALYAFPKTPIADDSAFTDVLLKHRVLAVPGRGFGRPGYIRLAFCVERRVIEAGLPALKAAIDEVR